MAKDPVKVRAGQIGAQKRWGNHTLTSNRALYNRIAFERDRADKAEAALQHIAWGWLGPKLGDIFIDAILEAGKDDKDISAALDMLEQNS